MEEYFANKLGLNTFGTYNATVSGTEKISQGGILDKMMLTRGSQFESQMYLDQNMKDSFMNSFLWMSFAAVNGSKNEYCLSTIFRRIHESSYKCSWSLC